MSVRNFAALGVYGFEPQAPAIFAALVTGDPLLLIGRSGTGKTFLLNSISEALGLEHRHYNASLLSFDDLVGFPYPDEARTSVRFLETPATIWGAESVLVDEISRCKPEHQNRLFSLVHERRVQGMPLEKLRYRWAAMNPCPADGGGEEYLGSEPLDPALADRFGVIVEVGDWGALSDEDRRRVADPAGEGALADDGGALKRELATLQAEFARRLQACPPLILDYVTGVVTALGEAGIRVSPRRARLMARTLLAATLVEGVPGDALFLSLLECSLPHRAWGEPPDPAKVRAAHQLAWGASALTGAEQWLHRFHLEKPLHRKLQLLLEGTPTRDLGTLAIEQLLSRETRPRQAAFALATYPAAVAGRLPIGAEAVNDLGRVASELLTINGSLTWHEIDPQQSPASAKLGTVQKLLADLAGPRQARARQLLYWCLLKDCLPRSPRDLEVEFNGCVELLAGSGQ
ncbi:MAG: MoxR family ATPase [Chromatiales bacterium]|nr:MoxR family ATPase [Chromatiales bacterium]